MQHCSLKLWEQTIPHSRREYSMTCQFFRRPYADNGTSHSARLPVTALTQPYRFCSLFYYAIPAEYHLRVWDVFLFEGMHPIVSTSTPYAHDSHRFRDPILVPRWPSAAHVLPRSPIGDTQSRPRAFHLVPGSPAMSTVQWRRFDRTGDVEEVEGR
jgi:hypothetical protein